VLTQQIAVGGKAARCEDQRRAVRRRERPFPEDDDAAASCDRCREAAMRALDQLDWVVGYLYEIRKPKIARAIARNRRQILEHLR
jgi:hypothetical protein